MKLALVGATDLTLAAAQACARAGVPVACVATAEPEFAIGYAPGGIKNFRHADVAGWAAAAGLPVGVGADRLEAFLAAQAPDFALVVGWYHLVPARVRRRLPRGCAGLHASLLPQLRGGAPLNWAILSGLARTGITLFELGDGVDDGPIYGQRGFDIAPGADVGDLVKLAEAAAVELIESCLPAIARGTLLPTAQAGTPSYALQRRPEDGAIDWTRSAQDIERLVRATTRPYPGAYSTFDGQRVSIWRGVHLRQAPNVLGAPGQIARLPEIATPCVVTGDGVFGIHEATDASGADAVPALARAANRRFE